MTKTTSRKLLTELIEASGSEYADIVEDGITGSDVNRWIDTGSYVLNALVSGSIYLGLPGNKISAFAGSEATGKTFFALTAVKNFLDETEEEGGIVIYWDTEAAITKADLVARGIDVSRMAIVSCATVEEFREQSINVLTNYINQDEKEKKPMMMVLDSLGMLSTNKEMADAEAGKNVVDMTRTKIIKSVFRILTLKCGKAGVPILVTNHTYDVIGSTFPTKEMSGGGGLKYAASMIVALGKRKDKDGTERIGSVIPAKTMKSRFTKEEMKVEPVLRFESGLQRYGGLVELAVDLGVLKKDGKKVKIGTKSYFAKHIYKNAEKMFTESLLNKIDAACKEHFMFGNADKSDDANEEVAEEVKAPAKKKAAVKKKAAKKAKKKTVKKRGPGRPRKKK
jgi:RecA/RadA recombinase